MENWEKGVAGFFILVIFMFVFLGFAGFVNYVSYGKITPVEETYELGALPIMRDINPATQTCIANTDCNMLNYECGQVDDGCGNILDCGSCPDNFQCWQGK